MAKRQRADGHVRITRRAVEHHHGGAGAVEHGDLLDGDPDLGVLGGQVVGDVGLQLVVQGRGRRGLGGAAAPAASCVCVCVCVRVPWI